MASLSIARPGKVPERQYLGDLACLFDRQRRRFGLALTPDSFASDLVASDSLRSGLFTLCAAISRMAESDLSPEELLGLVARALDGAGSAEGETGAPIPAGMRDAFLSGYAAWLERPNAMPGGVIPFPGPRGNVAAQPADGPRGADFDLDAFARRRPAAGARAEDEDAFLARETGPDDRPPGIDALLAAAPAWASATPTARIFNEEAFLSRHAYLSPASHRPIAAAPASLGEAALQSQLFTPMDELPQVPAFTPAQAAPVFPAPPAPQIGLDTEEDPLLSPLERLHAYVLGLPPRKVFVALASLTVFAGGLAGLMAYHTLHDDHVPQFKDLEPTAYFATPPASSAPAAPGSPAAAPAGAAQATIGAPNPAAEQAPVAAAPKLKSHVPPARRPAVAVWPPASGSAQASGLTTQPAAPSRPLYVPAPTMIGYALASPRPVYPSSLASGVSGAVAVEMTVSRLGDVISARAVSGPPQLRAAAAVAARGWRFRPYLVDGRPVEVSTTLQFSFAGE